MWGENVCSFMALSNFPVIHNANHVFLLIYICILKISKKSVYNQSTFGIVFLVKLWNHFNLRKQGSFSHQFINLRLCCFLAHFERYCRIQGVWLSGAGKSTLSSWWFNYDPNPFEVLVTTFPQYDDVTEYFIMSKMSLCFSIYSLAIALMSFANLVLNLELFFS